MNIYEEELKEAQARGWAVPLVAPKKQGEWIWYWGTLSDRDRGFIRGPEPNPPDNTFRGSREGAREKRLRRYWTGTPCSRGHRAPRITGTGACYACVKGL